MTVYLGVMPDDPPAEPEPGPDEAALTVALTRFLGTAGAPAYLVKAASPWLIRRTS